MGHNRTSKKQKDSIEENEACIGVGNEDSTLRHSCMISHQSMLSVLHMS